MSLKGDPEKFLSGPTPSELAMLAVEDAKGVTASGRAFTETLFVSPDGDGSNGSSWDFAYTTIQDALDAASTDVNDATLIMIAPTSSYYNINTAGDPTWAANVELRGTHRIWAPIRNIQSSATSILKFTGKASIKDLAIFQSSGAQNGVIFKASGWRVRQCGFNSETVTGSSTSICIDGSSAQTRGGIMEDVQFQPNVGLSRCLHVDNSKVNEFRDIHIDGALTGIHITGASDENAFHGVDIGDSVLGIDIDSGQTQHFVGMNFHDNTRNIDDEVGNHTYNNIKGSSPVYIYPDDFTGINAPSHANANEWGVLTQVVSLNAIDNPFRIVGVIFAPAVSQWSRVRITADSATTFSNEYMFDASRKAGNSAPAGTDFIYNANTKIEAQTKVVGTGPDAIPLWFKIQGI